MKWQISLGDIEQFAKQFWNEAGDTRVFACHGQMGAGKTTTIAALARQKGVREPVSSPTFSIINEYSYPEGEVTRSMFHIDLYRLKDEEEIIQSGVEDSLYSGAICFVEWPQKALHLFDKGTLHIIIQHLGENIREIELLSASAFDAFNMQEQL